jgi:phosphate acetyltransferase
MSSFLQSIHERAAVTRRRIAFCELEDERITAAMRKLTNSGLVEVIPVQNTEADPRFNSYVETYFTLRQRRGCNYDEARDVMRDPLFFAAMMVRSGDADGSVAGVQRTTADVLRAALTCVGPAPGIKWVSSAFYMVLPNGRILTFTDASVIPDPNEEQLADIAEAAASARAKIVGDEPRIAFLSYSTHGSAKSASVAKVRAAASRFSKRRPDIVADGELQADAALVEEIARRKAPDSPIVGNANVLVFPNLDAGNIAYKLVQRLADAQAVGPVLQGLAKPCNDLSRGASVDDIVNVACITALQAAVSREQNLPRAGAAV